jgi:hypothetical protein
MSKDAMSEHFLSQVINEFWWFFLPELFCDVFLHYATSENGFSANENLCP